MNGCVGFIWFVGLICLVGFVGVLLCFCLIDVVDLGLFGYVFEIGCLRFVGGLGWVVD